MRVLLTGGSGFIGQHLRAHLSTRHRVFAPTHTELDLADSPAVERWLTAHPVDAVVHGAVKPGHRNAPDPTGLTEQNLRQFFSLVRSRDKFGRLVVLGSGAAYGAHRPLVRVAETALGKVVPVDDHGFSKYVEAMWLTRDPNAVELRPFGVYGPGEDYAIRFISNACCKALLGMPITLRRDRLFSYVWVEDLVAVVELALEDGPQGLAPGAYNVTPGPPISLRDLADHVVDASGKAVSVVVAEEGRGPEYSGDGSKLAAVAPSLTFSEPWAAIERLLSWYRDRLDRIDRTVLETDR